MSDGKCIYVVDDEQVIAKTICLILEHHGYSTKMFMSAESTLKQFREKAPDLVLSDVVLNGDMTGLDLAETLGRELPRLPVMLFSGQAHTSQLLDAAETRGFRYLVHAKPMAPTRLLQEVERLLQPAD